MILEGDESYDTLKLALDQMKFFSSENTVLKKNGKELKLNLVYVMDMKLLNIFMGYKSLSTPSCWYRCPYCYVNNDLISDFSIEHWNLRDNEERAKMESMINKIGHKSASKDSKNWGGISNPPIVNLSSHDTPPCSLHLLAGIFRVVMDVLELTVKEDQKEKIFTQVLSKPPFCFNTVYSSSKTFKKNIPRSSFNKMMKIFSLKDKFLEMASPFFEIDKYRLFSHILETIAYLLDLTVNYQASRKEELDNYRNLSRQLGHALYNSIRYAPTPYFHLFIYHVPDFLSKYPSLFHYSNFSIENMIMHLKSCKPNGFHKNQKKDALYQQISFFIGIYCIR